MIVSSFVWTKHPNVTNGQTDTDRSVVTVTAVCIASHADAL